MVVFFESLFGLFNITNCGKSAPLALEKVSLFQQQQQQCLVVVLVVLSERKPTTDCGILSVSGWIERRASLSRVISSQ